MKLNFEHTMRKKKLIKIKEHLHDLKKELKKNRQDAEYLEYNNLALFIKIADDGSQLLGRIPKYQSTISKQKTLIETMKQEMKVTRKILKQTNTDIVSCRSDIAHLARKTFEAAKTEKERILSRIEEDKETLKSHKIEQIRNFQDKYEQQIEEIKKIRTSEMDQKRHEFEVRERMLQAQNETIRAESKRQLKILLIELERIKEGVFNSQKANSFLKKISNEASRHTKPSMKHFNQWRAQRKTNEQELKELKNFILQMKTQVNTIRRQTIEDIHRLNEMVNAGISDSRTLILKIPIIQSNKNNKTLVASRNMCGSLKRSLNLLKDSFNSEINLFMSDYRVLEFHFEAFQRGNSFGIASLIQVEQIGSIDSDSQRINYSPINRNIQGNKTLTKYPLIVLKECAQSKDFNSGELTNI